MVIIINSIIMKKQFIEFLKANEAYKNFVRNAAEDHHTTLDSLVARWINNPYAWIMCAFDWDNVPESAGYWHDLHQKWVKQLDELEEQK